MPSLFLPTFSSFELFANRLAKQVSFTDTIALTGAIGVGKTTLVRCMLPFFSPFEVDAVQSPTFPLVLSYETQRGTVYHVDLYRLRTKAEVAFLGLEELMSGGLMLVEWPEMASHILAPDTLYLTLNFRAQGREVSLEGSEERWKEALIALCD